MNHRLKVEERRGMARSAAVMFVCVCVLGLAAEAQQPVAPAPDGARLETLASQLTDGVSCTGDKIQDSLADKVKKSGADLGDVGVALALVSSSNDLCPAIRTAASTMNADISAQQAKAMEAEHAAAVAAAETSKTLVADVSLEAEVQAASMRFEVGPPPRNLTRGRATP